uniref:Protein MON2 homolog n=1 Tax=Culicoides sonorensis TaxID=179676 RepID=A0A336JYA7_CULSO
MWFKEKHYLRQLVTLVFDRMMADHVSCDFTKERTVDLEQLKLSKGNPPKGLYVSAVDAYLLFQDLVQLVDADQPYWLLGMTEMTRTFGLELLEAYSEFSFLLKERVCALVIKLFSPHIKYRSSIPSSLQPPGTVDKPYFPISMHTDKPAWQRALALEVLHKIILQPDLLVSFCECYDIKDHATNIFQDIVNSLGVYVQDCFSHLLQITGTTTLITTNCPGTGPSPGFSYREMLDKMEPPQISEGYGLSVTYVCILDLVRSILFVIQGSYLPTNAKIIKNTTSDKEKELYIQLINSSFNGILTGLYLLCDAATDENLTDTCLNYMQAFTALCGSLDLIVPRDAFVNAFCRAALPPHYAHTILNMNCHEFGFKVDTHDMISNYTGPCIENDFRHQVVAVGTPLPTLAIPLGAQLGPVMLTAKNLQCMRELLRLSLTYGEILGSSWYTVLVTLQHLAWILGLKPQTGGSLQVQAKATTDTNSITHVMSELPILSNMISQLFESSQHLSNESLNYLIEALCQLSQEAIELSFSNREPSLFAVAKLLETGLVNLFRVEVYWNTLTSHLLEVSSHPQARIREWGVEAVTYLVKSSLQHKYEKPLKDNAMLQIQLLSPLAELSSLNHLDSRQKQLECILQILNGSGEILTHGWPLILGVIGAVNEHHGETLIRIAFQCLQLVITDFLPAMPFRCLPLCINTATKFGLKAHELNISLTAIGLMWNISDYFNQNHEKISSSYEDDKSTLPDFSGVSNMSSFDKLWMCLYSRLGELCIDSRPAVRKSSGQTLFSTITAHGGLLTESTWQIVFWQVLFPLLDKVRQQASQASSDKVDTSGNILIHHSRNTAQKQWAETQVLTLSGVSKVFNTKRQILQSSENFNRAWCFLLDVIEFSSLQKNNEVSLAALKSFQELLYNNTADDQYLTETLWEIEMWNVAWRFWLNIGIESTNHFMCSAKIIKMEEVFGTIDLKQLCSVLTNAIAIPVHNDSTQYIISTVTDSSLTPLHEAVLNCIEFILIEVTANESLKNEEMIIILLRQLMVFSKYACEPPNLVKDQDISSNEIEWVNMNYIPFGEKSMLMLIRIYQQTADQEVVIKNDILFDLIKSINLSLSLKYKCMSSSTWKLAVSNLMIILDHGLKVARKHPSSFTNIWKDRGLDELVLDESIDCQIIELLRDKVLPFSGDIPDQFILDIVVLLNKGSIHSLNYMEISKDTNMKLRESFAKVCFETLLQFSLLSDLQNSNNNNVTLKSKEGCVAGRFAVTALLHRFEEILKKYNEDEQRSGACPLPRYRTSEISYVLKSIATLIASLKKVQTDKVGLTAWNQLIAIYPYLVDCTTTSSAEVSRSLKEALKGFSDLIQAPKY